MFRPTADPDMLQAGSRTVAQTCGEVDGYHEIQLDRALIMPVLTFVTPLSFGRPAGSTGLLG